MAGRRLPPERVREVLDHLAAGMNPAQASRAAGVSLAFSYGLHHKMGGVYRPPSVSYSARYLDREERYELARLLELGLSRRQAAARLGRHPSTIGRELDRNADPRTGAYQPERAHRLAWERQRRPKPSKLSRNPVLRAEVQGLLTRRYSPEQASGRLRLLHPDDPAMRVSHETIYQSIYLYPRGGLKRELQACLRSGRGTRRRRGRREMRGKIIGAVPIGARPPEVQGRLVPGHHEGDLVMGSAASNSAVGTIVERTTGYLTLLHLPDGHAADAVADAVISRLGTYPGWFARTLTWDAAPNSPATPVSPPKPGSASTSPTRTRPGSAAATRTSTGCSANTSPRAPTSARTPPPSSSKSKTNSTTGPASASAGTPPARNSIGS